MKTLLTGFKTEFSDLLLDLLWRQWTALGVTGQVSPWKRTVIDPEALLLTSCTIARHDPRLFDAILDWLQVNGRYLSVHRLHRMVAEYPFAGGAVYAAVAATASNPAQAVKWRGSAKTMKSQAQREEPLFRMADERPLPVIRMPDPVFLAHGLLRDHYKPRGTAHPFCPELPANLLLRLRAFLGVSARCEVLAYLLLNESGSPRAVARACGYYPATVTRAMSEMSDSGYVISRVQGRHRHYTLLPDSWRALLVGRARSSWVTWAPLFSALEQIWEFLHAPGTMEEDGLGQASALRRVLKSDVLENIARSGLPVIFGDDQPHSGESLIPFFIARMRMVLDTIQKLG